MLEGGIGPKSRNKSLPRIPTTPWVGNRDYVAGSAVCISSSSDNTSLVVLHCAARGWSIYGIEESDKEFVAEIPIGKSSWISDRFRRVY
jgi:hypothetical protein